MEKEGRTRGGRDDKEGNGAEINESKVRMERRRGISLLIRQIKWIEGRQGTAQEIFGKMHFIFRWVSTLEQK